MDGKVTTNSKSRKRRERRKKLKNKKKIKKEASNSNLNKIVIDGYFRFIENKIIYIIIPNEIKNIIIKYIKSYLIYGCGYNEFNELGIYKLNILKWTRLYELESLLLFL